MGNSSIKTNGGQDLLMRKRTSVILHSVPSDLLLFICTSESAGGKG